MLEDGFRSHRYSDIVGNLRDNGFLTAEDVRKLLKEYTTTQKITFDCIDDELDSVRNLPCLAFKLKKRIPHTLSLFFVNTYRIEKIRFKKSTLKAR